MGKYSAGQRTLHTIETGIHPYWDTSRQPDHTQYCGASGFEIVLRSVGILSSVQTGHPMVILDGCRPDVLRIRPFRNNVDDNNDDITIFIIVIIIPIIIVNVIMMTMNCTQFYLTIDISYHSI